MKKTLYVRLPWDLILLMTCWNRLSFFGQSYCSKITMWPRAKSSHFPDCIFSWKRIHQDLILQQTKNITEKIESKNTEEEMQNHTIWICKVNFPWKVPYSSLYYTHPLIRSDQTQSSGNRKHAFVYSAHPLIRSDQTNKHSPLETGSRSPSF